MLSKSVPFRKEREEMIKQKGYPAYTTAVGLDLHFNLNIFYYEIVINNIIATQYCYPIFSLNYCRLDGSATQTKKL